jgi:hypothetical protein
MYSEFNSHTKLQRYIRFNFYLTNNFQLKSTFFSFENGPKWKEMSKMKFCGVTSFYHRMINFFAILLIMKSFGYKICFEIFFLFLVKTWLLKKNNWGCLTSNTYKINNTGKMSKNNIKIQKFLKEIWNCEVTIALK